jgi:hypothetical protein
LFWISKTCDAPQEPLYSVGAARRRHRYKGYDFGLWTKKSCSRKIYANKQMINLVYSYEQKKSIATNSPTHSNINYKVGLGKYW